MARTGAASLLAAAALLWLAWPLLRPQLGPAQGEAWIVVLDGYQRLDVALAQQQGRPILLITCPTTGQPTAEQWQRRKGRLRVLQQGSDTVEQAVVLARWLQQRQQAQRPLPARILLVSSPHHFPRASWATQLAIGSLGSTVIATPAPTGEQVRESRWSAWRDALRVQLWRATGSTGSFLVPSQARAKQAACHPHTRIK